MLYQYLIFLRHTVRTNVGNNTFKSEFESELKQN